MGIKTVQENPAFAALTIDISRQSGCSASNVQFPRMRPYFHFCDVLAILNHGVGFVFLFLSSLLTEVNSISLAIVIEVSSSLPYRET